MRKWIIAGVLGFVAVSYLDSRDKNKEEPTPLPSVDSDATASVDFEVTPSIANSARSEGGQLTSQIALAELGQSLYAIADIYDRVPERLFSPHQSFEFDPLIAFVDDSQDYPLLRTVLTFRSKQAAQLLTAKVSKKGGNECRADIAKMSGIPHKTFVQQDVSLKSTNESVGKSGEAPQDRVGNVGRAVGAFFAPVFAKREASKASTEAFKGTEIVKFTVDKSDPEKQLVQGSNFSQESLLSIISLATEPLFRKEYPSFKLPEERVCERRCHRYVLVNGVKASAKCSEDKEDRNEERNPVVSIPFAEAKNFAKGEQGFPTWAAEKQEKRGLLADCIEEESFEWGSSDFDAFVDEVQPYFLSPSLLGERKSMKCVKLGKILPMQNDEKAQILAFRLAKSTDIGKRH